MVRAAQLTSGLAARVSNPVWSPVAQSGPTVAQSGPRGAHRARWCGAALTAPSAAHRSPPGCLPTRSWRPGRCGGSGRTTPCRCPARRSCPPPSATIACTHSRQRTVAVTCCTSRLADPAPDPSPWPPRRWRSAARPGAARRGRLQRLRHHVGGGRHQRAMERARTTGGSMARRMPMPGASSTASARPPLAMAGDHDLAGAVVVSRHWMTCVSGGIAVRHRCGGIVELLRQGQFGAEQGRPCGALAGGNGLLRMDWPRSFEQARQASPRVNAPAAASRRCSPSECPATTADFCFQDDAAFLFQHAQHGERVRHQGRAGCSRSAPAPRRGLRTSGATASGGGFRPPPGTARARRGRRRRGRGPCRPTGFPGRGR